VEDYLGMKSRGLSKGMGDLSFEKFELGQYTIGLAKDFNGIREFLNQLVDEKRPEISEELKNFFQEKYAGWGFAICVFDSNKTIDAQPIAFEYKPFGEQLIYFPTMDGHDGAAPDVNAYVDTDHTFIYEHTGSMEIPAGKQYKFVQEFVTLKAEVPSFLQNRKYRVEYVRGYQKNGDTFIDNKKMSESNFMDEPEFKRIQPVPYAVTQ